MFDHFIVSTHLMCDLFPRDTALNKFQIHLIFDEIF